MRFPRLRSSRSTLLPIVLLVAAMIFWPTMDRVSHQSSSAQGVSWLSSDSISYLTSSGIPVMVPSWLPGPVAGTTPEIYAGGGSYSIYFYAGSSFLYITGVAGGGFPGGSEANLNVELSINSSVLGYPAIHDLGIPEGSESAIYDKVMWIADGVFYTVSGNGLDSDSVSLANSSAVLYQQAAPEPAPTDPPVVVEEPVTAPEQVESGVVNEATEPTGSTTTTSQPGNNQAPETSSTTTTSGNSETDQGTVDESADGDTPTASGSTDDGTGGPWYTGSGVEGGPSDGTSGATPPFLADDGTGGAP